MVDEIKKIDDWQIQRVFLDASMTHTVPVIQGIVDGKRVKTETLLWFDFEGDIAMTNNQIFRIGEPNPQWMGAYLASGRDPEDLEIKGTTH